MTDYRALCAELLAALEIQLDELRFNNRLCVRARAALAQPIAPTNEELDELFVSIDEGASALNWRTYARAVLARWGTPVNPTPEAND